MIRNQECLDAIATDDNSVELSLPEKCWVIEYGLYALIRPNGDVFSCVVSPYTNDNSMGNVNIVGFEEIWQGVKHCKIKNKLHKDMKSCQCNLDICRHMRYNFLLDADSCLSTYVNTLPVTTKIKPKLL